MTAYFSDPWLTIHEGDCRAVLAEMEPESVHCVVTSPPYWGLRDYGTPGQLGLEATPEAYVAALVDVFREVRRVLRADGTVWLNLGDSYANPGNKRTGEGETRDKANLNWGRFKDDYDPLLQQNLASQRRVVGEFSGLKPKDLVGIPWRVAFALQADGWYLRSDIIWSKPNPMPESVTDRPTKSHEYLFLLSKSARYWFDADAVREPHEASSLARVAQNNGNPTFDGSRERRAAAHIAGADTFRPDQMLHPAGRNIRSVWTIATAPYPGAHFATFPPKLVEPCIKAGCPDKVCGECGAPWERVVERPEATLPDRRGPKHRDKEAEPLRRSSFHVAGWRNAEPDVATTLGFRPTCAHDAPTVPGVVLDPFAGTGTVGLVAQRLSRRAVLIDLNAEYLAQCLARNAQTPLGLESA